jgi:signal transduction histidine kinase
MDLHDHIIQTLIYANISLSRIRDHATDRMATETVEEVYQCLQQSIQALRTLTFEISSPVLYELGFIPAVAWLVRQFQEKHHLQISFDHTVSIEVSEQIGGLLFQAVRELLTNVVKHAQATHVLVHVAQKNRLLKIVVEDDGIGLGRAGLGVDADRSSGFGMFNIRERIGSLKGTMKVVSAPAKGTRVELTLPYASRSSHAQGTL